MNRFRLKSLFQAIGSEERLRSLLLEFYTSLSTDILIGFFFHQKDLSLIANHQADFLLFAMGETDSYSGKRPQDAHDKLPPILGGHFDRRIKILEEFLIEKGFSKEHTETWVEFEKSFRKAIVKS